MPAPISRTDQPEEQRPPQASDPIKLDTSTVLYAPIQLFSRRFQALLDTGASCNLISSRLVKRLLDQKCDIRVNRQLNTASAINNSRLTIEGTAILPIRFANGLSFDVKFSLSPEINHLVVLGMDFIRLTKPCMDFKTESFWLQDSLPDFPQLPLRQNRAKPKSNRQRRRELRASQREAFNFVTGHTTSSLPLDESADSTSVSVVTNAYLTVPARCEALFLVPNPARRRSALVVPAANFHHQYGVQMALAIVNIKDGNVPIRILNSTDNEILIPPLRRIAKLETFQLVHAPKEQVNSVSDDESMDEEWVDARFKFSNPKLTQDQLWCVKQLIWQYRDRFNQVLGNTALAEHRIDLTSDVTPKAHGYRIPEAHLKVVQAEIDKMLNLDIISPSQSPMSAPIVLVKKKDGTLRFCVDYRKLNAVTQKDVYPLPRIDDILSKLSGNVYFSTFDADSGFWQISIRATDRHKTAFTSPFGLFEFNRMPFGLCNAPATFQRLMDVVLAGLLWKNCLVYVDDIIVFGRTFDEHLENLSLVLDALRAANITLKASKCKLLCEEIQFLGHVVSATGVATDPEKVNKISSMPAPRNTHEIKVFTGLTGYYRKFIKDYASIAEPLNKLLRKEGEWHWADEQQSAFDELKKRLTEAPILAFPDFKLPFTLFTDASNHGIGSVLSQFQNGKEVVICYYSRTLNTAERNYSTTERECLAIVDSVKNFRYYLIGRRFEVVVDHHSLRWLKTVSDNSQRLARWSLQLQEFDYDVTYRPGKQHSNSDALSRLTVGEVINMVSTMTDFRDEQMKDPMLRCYIEYLTMKSLPADELLRQDVIKACRDMAVIDGLLFRIWYPQGRRNSEPRSQLVVPLTLYAKVIEEHHDSSIAGHLGFFKTYERIRERYFWDHMLQDIATWVSTCEQCIRRKRTKTIGLLKPMHSSIPFETIGMDILGPFSPTKNGNRYIIVIVDYFTKWVEAFALPDQSTLEIAKKLVEEVVCRHGAPRRILTDQGSNFSSALAQDIYQVLNSKKVRTTAYHPQTDGLTEKFNHTLATMLTHYVNEYEDDWDEYINYVLFAYRTAAHHSTKYSPFFLLYGRQARMPSDLDQFNRPDESTEDLDEYARDLLRKLNMSFGEVRDNSLLAKQRQKQQYDKPRIKESIKVGDKVYLDLIVGSKLSYKNEGPFKVTHVKGLVCDLQHLENKSDVRRVNVSQLRRTPVRETLTTTNGEQSSSDAQPSDGLHAQLEEEAQQIPKRKKSREPTLLRDLTRIRDVLNESNFSANKKVVLQLIGKGSPFITSSKLEQRYDKEIRALDNSEDLKKYLTSIIRDNGVSDL